MGKGDPLGVPYNIMKKCRVCNVDLVVGENITPIQASHYNWSCKSCSRKDFIDRHNKKKEEDVAGVYGIYYKSSQLIYVGESNMCEWRFRDHKRESKRPNHKRCVGLNPKYIKDYSQKIFKEEEDERLRKQMEMELIVKHKPILNYPYREPDYIHI